MPATPILPGVPAELRVVTTVDSIPYTNTPDIFSVSFTNKLTGVPAPASAITFDGEAGLLTCDVPGIYTMSAETLNGKTAEADFRVGNTLLLPAGTTKVESEAFINANFHFIVIPDSCTAIGASAFAGNPVIAVDVPDGLTVTQKAFAGLPADVLIYASADSVAYNSAAALGFNVVAR